MSADDFDTWLTKVIVGTELMMSKFQRSPFLSSKKKCFIDVQRQYRKFKLGELTQATDKNIENVNEAE